MPKMLLKVVFKQRQCSYPGQYAPEAHAIETEFEYEDSPDFLEKELQIALADDSIVAAKIIDVEVDQDKIAEMLNSHPVIAGEIKSE